LSATYWVQVGDDFLPHFSAALPPGLSLEGFSVQDAADVIPGPAGSDVSRLPGAHWHRLRDEGAGPELEGCTVRLVFRAQDGRIAVARRELLELP
jgi:hypothetical protein